METLLLNPISLWLRWLFTKAVYLFKNRGKHLKIEYMVELSGCTFGYYNTIYKYTRLRNTSIDSFSYVARNTLVQHAKIGKFCCIGPHVSIGLGAHPSSQYVSSHPLFYSTIGQASGLTLVEKELFQEYQETIIENDVWIGAQVIIKSGVKIGNGAIIASGAVVTKDVEPYSIVGGVPAKFIKYRFAQEQINFLQKFKWWEQNLDWLKEHKDLFLDVDLLMKKFNR